jgi:hypothetical protein
MADLLGAARGVQPPPRPWPALLFAAGVALLVGSIPLFNDSHEVYLALTILAVLLLVAGIAGLAPWAAYRTARRLAGRAGSAATLLAARRLTADPRATARAAAAVGAVAMTGGVIGPFVVDAGLPADRWEIYDYLVPTAIVGACALVALAVIAASLAIHSTETFLERRREMAALTATGVPASVVVAAQRRECLIATVPLAATAALVSGVGYSLLADVGPVAVAAAVAGTVITTGVVAGAVTLTTRLLRPWLRQALSAEHLRTE